MTCLFITALLYFSYYYLFSTTLAELLSRKILLSVVMSCAQIVMTELLLGICNNLHVSYLLGINLLIAFLIILSGYRLSKQPFLATVKNDFYCLRRSWVESKDFYTVTLGILALATYTWIFAVSYYLPPRGIDDLAYHLPTIFEYIQSHKISLLPVELRYHFAFPENAELLFMWPTIFAGNQRLIDSANLPFVFLSILSVYALLRHFEISGRNALLAALLYALCPVVIIQSGVNYIDIILSLFFILSLYFSLLFHSGRRRIYLFAAAISIGMMLGMKYTALLLALPLQLLIFPGLVRAKWHDKVGYITLVIALCGWWYARNMVVFNDPFYPMDFLGLLPVPPGKVSLFDNILLNLPHWTTRYLIEDTGVGTYDGGFGLFFWGMGFSSWLYISVHSLLHINKTGLSRFIMLAYLPVGFILLLAVPEADVPYVGRMAMFIVVIGLYSFCETMKLLNDKFAVSALKFTCIALSILTVGLVFSSVKPSYSISSAFADRLSHKYPSEFKYMSDAIRTRRAAHGYAWEALDFLTRSDKTGLYCYIITDPAFFAPAPVYGSNLQNRIAYSHKQAKGTIEAYVCTYFAGFQNVKLDELRSSYDIITNGDYFLVAHWNYSCLILHKSIFRDPAKQELLAQYYKNTWPEAITAAMQIKPFLSEKIPVITSSQIGYGLQYLETQPQQRERTVMTPNGLEEMVASQKSFTRCYTFNKPLAGYSYKQMARVVFKTAEIRVYLNWKP
ncbi:MAG: glycosyltransferase family 39 protein [Geobacteraceae bacterium]|nr:glycosyltransferase family 39 protein [Geobacteraceae bacterium]